MIDKNPIKYAIANNIAKKMLREGLISQDEYDRIDVLNKKKFSSEDLVSEAVAIAVANADDKVSGQEYIEETSKTPIIYKSENQTAIRDLAHELGRHPTKFHDWVKKHNY